MWVSTKGRYALQVTLYLPTHDTGAFIPLKAISESQGITEKRLEQIIPPQNRVGYLHSARGNNGDYRLSHKPEGYLVGDIIRINEGSPTSLACLEDPAHGYEHRAVVKQATFGQGWMR